MPDKQFAYYKDDAINPQLVTTMAQEWAKRFFDPKYAGKTVSGEYAINASQLRKFYGDVKNLEMRWQNSGKKEQAFREICPMIKLLKAKAAYVCKRKLVPKSFENWIGANVDQIDSERDFRAFLLFFEAVVGFCYGNGLTD